MLCNWYVYIDERGYAMASCELGDHNIVMFRPNKYSRMTLYRHNCYGPYQAVSKSQALQVYRAVKRLGGLTYAN